MRRNGFNPSGDRTKGGMTWAEFIKIHKDVIWATDFFTAEVWTPFGLVTYYVLFFIQIKTKKVIIPGITAHPNDDWMAQIARNLTGWDSELKNAKYLIHDRDTKYSVKFDAIMRSAGIKPIKLPPRSPNLNAFSERWVKSVKTEILDKQVLFGKKSLQYVLREYVAHFHEERNRYAVFFSSPPGALALFQIGGIMPRSSTQIRIHSISSRCAIVKSTMFETGAIGVSSREC